MIPEAYIIEWKRYAPWRTDAQVEQDLILSRVLVSKMEFRNNLDLKLQNSDFKDDIKTLVRPDISYSIEDAFHMVDDKLISRL